MINNSTANSMIAMKFGVLVHDGSQNPLTCKKCNFSQN